MSHGFQGRLSEWAREKAKAPEHPLWVFEALGLYKTLNEAEKNINHPGGQLCNPFCSKQGHALCCSSYRLGGRRVGTPSTDSDVLLGLSERMSEHYHASVWVLATSEVHTGALRSQSLSTHTLVGSWAYMTSVTEEAARSSQGHTPPPP